ncbi:MAG: hypothetical protein AAF645_19250, partial [Myxococcota bacterium]
DVSGLAVDCHPVKRGSADEFADVAEIDGFEFDRSRVRLEADVFAFESNCASADFELGTQDWVIQGDDEATWWGSTQTKAGKAEARLSGIEFVHRAPGCGSLVDS